MVMANGEIFPKKQVNLDQSFMLVSKCKFKNVLLSGIKLTEFYFAGLKRCGKSCRLRWINYLCPDIKRGNISPDEEDLIVRLHRLLGNRYVDNYNSLIFRTVDMVRSLRCKM